MSWVDYFVYNSGNEYATQTANARKMVMSAVVQPSAGRRQILIVNSTKQVLRLEDISASKDGSSWGNPIVVEAAPTTYTQPTLLIDSNGYLHALYLKLVSGYYRLRYAMSTDGGATWGDYSDVPMPYTNQHVAWPTACISGTDIIYAFGSQTVSSVNRFYVCAMPADGVGWNPYTAIPRKYPSTKAVAVLEAVALTYNGVETIEAVFAERNAANTYKLTNVYWDLDGNIWTLYPGPSPATPYVDYESIKAGVYASVAVDLLKNKVHLVYQKFDANNIYQIYYKQKSILGNDWGVAVRVNLATAVEGCQYPSVTFGVDGRIYVAWMQTTKGIINVNPYDQQEIG